MSVYASVNLDRDRPLFAVVSLGLLQSLDANKISALEHLGIFTIGDLLHYRPFHIAQFLVAVSRGDIAHDVSLNHAVDTQYQDRPASELTNEPINALSGIGPSTAAVFNDVFEVETINDLATFEPFIEAQNYLADGDGRFRESPSAPRELVPTMSGATVSTARYSSIIREFDLRNLALGFETMPPTAVSGMFDFSRVKSPVFYLGYVVRHRQSWMNRGTHLGEVVHSIPLAPGESRNVAILDWKRSTLTRRDEDTNVQEQVNSVQVHKRAIDEVARAVAEEHQFGMTSTEASTAATAASFVAAGGVVGGIGGGVAGALAGLAIGNAANVAAGAPTIGGAVAGTAIGAVAGMAAGGMVHTGVQALGMIESDSTGNRDIIGDVEQRIVQSTNQKTSAVRSLWSAVVLEDYEAEQQGLRTSNITNYNHMHALTVQYYEVLQHYHAQLQFERAEPLLFIPFRPLDFNSNSLIESLWPYLRDAVQDDVSEDLYNTAFAPVPEPEELVLELPDEPGDPPFNPTKAKIDEILIRIESGLSTTKVGVQIVRTDGTIRQMFHGSVDTPAVPNPSSSGDWVSVKDLSSLNPPGDGGTATTRIDHFGDPGASFKASEIRAVRVVNSAGIQIGTLGVDVAVRFRISQESEGEGEDQITFADQHVGFDDPWAQLGTLSFDGAETQDTDWSIADKIQDGLDLFEQASAAYNEAIEGSESAELEAIEAYDDQLQAQSEARESVYEHIRWKKYFYTRAVLSQLEPEQLTDLLDALLINGTPLHTLAHTVPIGMAGNHLLLRLKNPDGATAKQYMPLGGRSAGVGKLPDSIQAVLAYFRDWARGASERLNSEDQRRHYLALYEPQVRLLRNVLKQESLTDHDKSRLEQALDALEPQYRSAFGSSDLRKTLPNFQAIVLRTLPISEEVSEEMNLMIGYSNDIRAWSDEQRQRKPLTDELFLPTSGVFAEAVLGRSNSAEKLDITRFYNWQDSPIPNSAPAVAKSDPNQERSQQQNVTPTVPQSTINLVGAPSFPDPTGLTAILQAVQNGNMFRDMSKAEQLTSILGNLSTLAAEIGKASATMTGDAGAAALKSATEMGKEVAATTRRLFESADKLAASPASNPTEKGAIGNRLEDLAKKYSGAVGDPPPFPHETPPVGDPPPSPADWIDPQVENLGSNFGNRESSGSGAGHDQQIGDDESEDGHPGTGPHPVPATGGNVIAAPSAPSTATGELTSPPLGMLIAYFSQYEGNELVPSDADELFGRGDAQAFGLKLRHIVLELYLAARGSEGADPVLHPSDLFLHALNLTDHHGVAALICHNLTRSFARGGDYQTMALPWRLKDFGQPPQFAQRWVSYEARVFYPFRDDWETVDYIFTQDNTPDNLFVRGSDEDARPSGFYKMFSPYAFSTADPGDWYHYYLMQAITSYFTTQTIREEAGIDLDTSDILEEGKATLYVAVGFHVVDAVTRLLDQYHKNSYSPNVTPGTEHIFRGWLWANTMSMIEGFFYGADEHDPLPSVIRESKVHFRGARAGIDSVTGGMSQIIDGDAPNWRWYVPNGATLGKTIKEIYEELVQAREDGDVLEIATIIGRIGDTVGSLDSYILGTLDMNEQWIGGVPADDRSELRLGAHVPSSGEVAASGIGEAIVPDTPEYDALVTSNSNDIIFKDGLTNRMTPRMRDRLHSLAARVKAEFPGYKLRIQSLWRPKPADPEYRSLHWEGRAVDMTVMLDDPSNIAANQDDGKKLGRLAALAVESGFDWVFFENDEHVHASVRRE